jgi:hypothetical protein
VGPLIISLIAFGCIFGGMVLGMFLRRLLPEHHLSEDSKDVVKMGIGMVATLAALVLGLLIASAKGSFDTMNKGLIESGSKIILLDRIMAQYGPETMEAREQLRSNVSSVVEQLWSKDKTAQTERRVFDSKTGLEALQNKLRQLSPHNDAQRWHQSRALQVSADITESRWLLIEQHGQSSLPMPFFVMLVSWLVIIFFCFGLLAPRNATVIAVLLICALSATGALYLIQELDRPYGGLIAISDAPLREALSYLGR